MYIEAHVVDRETGNTLWTRRFRSTYTAEVFHEQHEDEGTVVIYRLVEEE